MNDVLDKLTCTLRDSAFPSKVNLNDRELFAFGLTKRELFAVTVLSGLLSNETYEKSHGNVVIVQSAVDYADKLLKELAK